MAVQSHFFGVGSLVSWAEAGVGAVATQSVVEPAYGPRGLALMRDGKSAPAALHQLLADDPQEPARQVAMIDRGGRVAVHTGARCIVHAGHAVGDQVSAQANIMERDTVPAAMVARLLGRVRRRPSPSGCWPRSTPQRPRVGTCAAASPPRCSWCRRAPPGNPAEDRPIDLRVEDHPDPVGELRRLVSLRRAYERVDVGDQLAAAGDVEGSLAEYEAAHRSQPDNLELAFWHGVALAASGREEDAAPILRRAFQAHEGWIELLKRLPAAGLFPDDGELIARLIGTRAVSEPQSAPPPAAL